MENGSSVNWFGWSSAGQPRVQLGNLHVWRTEMKQAVHNVWFWLQVGWYAVGWSLAIFIVWFGAVFTPAVSVKAEFTVHNGQFEFAHFSYKTPWSDLLCGKPTSSQIIFEDPRLEFVSTVRDNSTGYGTGDDRIRQFLSTGEVPPKLPKGVEVAVYKRIVYPCLGLNKEVDSEVKTFINR